MHKTLLEELLREVIASEYLSNYYRSLIREALHDLISRGTLVDFLLQLIEIGYRLYPVFIRVTPYNYLIAGVPLPEEAGNELADYFTILQDLKPSVSWNMLVSIYQDLLRKGEPIFPIVDLISGEFLLPLTLDLDENSKRVLNSFKSRVKQCLNYVKRYYKIPVSINERYFDDDIEKFITKEYAITPTIEVREVGHIPLISPLPVVGSRYFFSTALSGLARSFYNPYPISTIGFEDYLDLLQGNKQLDISELLDKIVNIYYEKFRQGLNAVLKFVKCNRDITKHLHIYSPTRFSIGVLASGRENAQYYYPEIEFYHDVSTNRVEVRPIVKSFTYIHPTVVLYPRDYDNSNLLLLLAFVSLYRLEDYLKRMLTSLRDLELGVPSFFNIAYYLEKTNRNNIIAVRASSPIELSDDNEDMLRNMLDKLSRFGRELDIKRSAIVDVNINEERNTYTIERVRELKLI